MVNPFALKSIFLWHVSSVGWGDPAFIAGELTRAGFESVMLHVESLGLFRSRFPRAFVERLKGAGVVIIGSSAIYGAVPRQEGEAAARLVREYDLAGFVFDAESRFEQAPQADSAAVHVMLGYQALTDAPSAWCSWAHFFSSGGVMWHPVRVMASAMRYADIAMPMQYWNWGNNPSEMPPFVDSSLEQWRRYTDKPIVPAGRAYIGDGGRALPETVTAYDRYIRDAGCQGVTWWSMQHAINQVAQPGVWNALASTPGFRPKKIYKNFIPGVMG